MYKKISILLICILLIGLPLYGDTLTDKKNELNDAKDSMSDAKSELGDNLAEQQALNAEIKALDAEIVTIENKLLETGTKLDKKEAQIEITKQELDEAIKKREIQYQSMKNRMVHMYKNSKVKYIQIIFASQSFSDMLNRMNYIKAISEYDQKLLGDYELQQQIIEDKKNTYENEKAEIEVLYNEQKEAKANLDQVRLTKNERAGLLEQREGQLHAEIEEFEKISKELEKEIQRLTAQSTVKYNGGAFAWPVPGHYRISSQYNPRENPITGNYEFHQGIDIPAPYGKPVLAAADGVVITAGWVRGFGNTVMIDHGSGIVTIYGHNSSVTVSHGQKVTKGQQVAKIGSTGYSTGNHCHFEVRIHGKHTSPWNYLGD